MTVDGPTRYLKTKETTELFISDYPTVAFSGT